MKPKLLLDAAERAMLGGYGIVADSAQAYMQPEWRNDFALAMDAQPTLITTPNAGVPAFLTNFIDPEVVRVLLAPMKIDEIIGTEKRGDWTTLSMQFPFVEVTGQVTSYGDFNNDGNTGANINFVPRQSYKYQTFSVYGELETEVYGLAKFNYVSELNVAAATVMAKFANKVGFFGVTGLQNYGLLNDPNLLASIRPVTKALGGYTWAVATAQEVYNDVLALFAQLQTQMAGRTDMNETMTLALSPVLAVSLNKVSSFNITARTTIQANFPNLRIVTAPEYATVGGQFMQLIIDRVDGVKTAFNAFTEKMRMHRIIPDSSSFKQKKSGGVWGAIIRRPIAITSMLGM